MSGKRERHGTNGDEENQQQHLEDNEDEEGEGSDESASSEDRKPSAEEKQSGQVKKKRRRRRRSTLQESKWQQMYQRLVAYEQENGDCLVPNRYAADPSLGAWVATQRRNYRVFMSGTGEPCGMTHERIRILEGIGFQWTTTDPRHEPWEVRYAALQEFVNKYGHAEIPMRWEENVQLSNWVSKQRQDYKLRIAGKSSRLTDERMKLLNDLGFKWHIPRKGRKIKQRSIPILKKNPNEVGRAGTSSEGSQGLPPGQQQQPPECEANTAGVDFGVNLPLFLLDNNGSFASEQNLPVLDPLAGGSDITQQATEAAVPDVARMPNNNQATQTMQQPVAGGMNQPPPLYSNGLQLPNMNYNLSGLDLGSLLALQSAISGAVNAATEAQAQALSFVTAPSDGSSVVQSQTRLPSTNQVAQALVQHQQNLPQTPAAILLPVPLESLLSCLQRQQMTPLVLPMSPGAPNVMNPQGIVLNLPAPATAPAASVVDPVSAQTVSTLVASLLGGNAGAASQHQPHLSRPFQVQQPPLHVVQQLPQVLQPQSQMPQQPQQQNLAPPLSATQPAANSFATLLANALMGNNPSQGTNAQQPPQQQQEQQQPPQLQPGEQLQQQQPSLSSQPPPLPPDGGAPV